MATKKEQVGGLDKVEDNREGVTATKQEGVGAPLVEEATDGEGSVFKDGREVEDFCGVEVIEVLCKSCLLPALASYLLNDSGTCTQEHTVTYVASAH